MTSITMMNIAMMLVIMVMFIMVMLVMVMLIMVMLVMVMVFVMIMVMGFVIFRKWEDSYQCSSNLVILLLKFMIHDVLHLSHNISFIVIQIVQLTKCLVQRQGQN